MRHSTVPRSESDQLPQETRPRDLFHPREHLAEFVRRLAKSARTRGNERRAEPRFQISIEVTAQPVDERLNPLAPEIIALMRDVSASGASLYVGRELECKYLVVKLTTYEGEAMNALLEIVRRQECGGMLLVAGKFVTKLYQSK